jgi:hypothetical protein
MGYSAEIWTLGHPILFSFTVVPIIFVERTSIFLKSGIWVTLDYIITLYSPLQTILSVPPFCVNASGKCIFSCLNSNERLQFSSTD